MSRIRCKYISDHIRDHLSLSLGVPPDPDKYNHIPTLEELKLSEWSEEFEKLMRHRLIMGGIRYGLLHSPGRPPYDIVESIRERLDIFNDTGNAEILVDIANLCLVMFETKWHPKHHFKSVDDGVHTAIQE